MPDLLSEAIKERDVLTALLEGSRAFQRLCLVNEMIASLEQDTTPTVNSGGYEVMGVAASAAPIARGGDDARG